MVVPNLNLTQGFPTVSYWKSAIEQESGHFVAQSVSSGSRSSDGKFTRVT
jgi:hypothetical protein